MKGKKYFLVLLVLSLVTAMSLAGCGGETESPPEDSNLGQVQPKETLIIGALFDLTGESSSKGISQRDTVSMLKEQLNSTGGINGHQVEVIINDTEGSEEKALEAARKLVNEDKVSVVIGSSTSEVSLALAQYLQQEQIPFVSLAEAAEIVEPVRNWVFKTSHSDKLSMEAVVKYLAQHNLNKVGFISETTSFGDRGRDEMEELAPGAGIQVVAWEQFGSDDQNVTAQLNNIRRANPDVLVIWAQPPAASVVQKNVRELGFPTVRTVAPIVTPINSHTVMAIDEVGYDEATGLYYIIGDDQLAAAAGLRISNLVEVFVNQGDVVESGTLLGHTGTPGRNIGLVIHSHGIGNMQFIAETGQAAEGVIFPSGKLLLGDQLPDGSQQKDVIIKYLDDFHRKFSYTPDVSGGYAWDAMMVVVGAFESNARTPAEIRDYLERKYLVGVSGVFNFSSQNHNGLDASALTWVEIQDGNFVYHQAVQ